MAGDTARQLVIAECEERSRGNSVRAVSSELLNVTWHGLIVCFCCVLHFCHISILCV